MKSTCICSILVTALVSSTDTSVDHHILRHSMGHEIDWLEPDEEDGEDEIPLGTPVDGRLINCPDCGNRISDTAETCPSCGEPIPPDPTRESGKASDETNEFVECPDCGADVSEQAELCPGCGRTMNRDTASEKGMRRGTIAGLTVIIGSIACVTGIVFSVLYGGADRLSPSATRTPSKGVKYRVTADGSVSVTFRNQDGKMVQKEKVSTPWTYPGHSENSTFIPDNDLYLQIAAQKTRWREEGRITVQIIVNGDVWKETNCTGAYCMVIESGLYRDAIK